MLAQFIEKILELSEVKEFEYHGHKYTTASLSRVKKPSFDLDAAPKVSTLGAIVDYISLDPDKIVQNLPHMLPLIIHVESQTKVTLMTSVYGEDLNRKEITSATPVLPSLTFGSPIAHEEFVIMMQSKFVRNKTVPELLTLVSSIRKVDEQQITDNGISQTATAKSGVSIVEKINIPNPVVLQPYRTFIEVEQPESEFVFRLNDKGQPSLHEADGGAWKIQAMKNISDFLSAALESQIQKGQVVILC